MSPLTFLTQLLPVVVFIVVDALVTDVRISILCAVLFAVGQLAVTWRRRRRFDWFVVLDVALVVAFGGVSIVLDNDLFFKIKPAIIEAISVVLMVGLIVAPDRFLIGYFGRIMPERALRPEAIRAMKALLGGLSLFTGLHIGAVLYTAFHSSKKVWAGVSGPGFYVVFVPMVAWVWWKRVRARRALRGGVPSAGPRSDQLTDS
jgi:intracellular septation protein A